MKLTLFAFTLLITITGFASQNENSFYWTAKANGFQIMTTLAATCNRDSWKKFADWAVQSRFETKLFQLKNTTRLSKRFYEFPEQKMTVSKVGRSHLQVMINKEKYTGDDACEIALKIPESLPATTNWLYQQLVPTAQAITVINDPNLKEKALIAMSGLMISDCNLFENWSFGTACGLVMMPVASNKILTVSNRSDFEKILSRPFKLFCSKGSISIQSDEKRLIVDKSTPNFLVESVSLKQNRNIASEPEVKTNIQGKLFAIETAKKCHNNSDAIKLMNEFNQTRKEVQSRITSVKLDVIGSAGMTH